MSVTINVTLNRFPDLAASLNGTLEQALDRGVSTLIEVADPLTPVDTGALRGNKSIARSGGSRTVTWNQHYAAYVHEGTYKMAARPFARMAVDPALAAIEAELGGWPG